MKGRRLKQVGSLGETGEISPSFLAHIDEPEDMYKMNIDKNEIRSDSSSNTSNLFDDSNDEDRKWTHRVRKFLGRNK